MLMVARLYPGYFDSIDRTIEAVFTPLQTFPHIELFLVITVLGSVTGIIVLALGALFLLRRNSHAVIQLFFLLVFASVSMGIAKMFVERARPEALLWLDPMNSFSFPSGHATLSTAFYGFIAVCLVRRTHSPILRTFWVALCIAVILAVGLSRLILNFHYFTDVLAGIFLGLFWLSVIFILPRDASLSTGKHRNWN